MSMDPAPTTTTTTSAPAWRRMVRRRSLAWDAVHAEERELGRRRRVDELREAVARLRAEKEAAERAAAALRAELESEQGASEIATSEAMLMIGRLQREKAAAMIEARAFRLIAESRAGRDRELQDRLAEACALAASYQALLRAHGIDPDDGADEEEAESDHQEERAVERDEVGVDGDKYTEDKGVLIEEPSSWPSPPPAAEEFKYAVDVTKPVAEERIANVAGDLCARVEALEADSAALRKEVAALQAERAQVVLARQLCRDATAVAAAEKQRFPVLAVFKWFFSTVLWGIKHSASAASNLQEAPKYQLVGDSMLPPLPASTPGEIQGLSADSEQN